MTLVGGCVWFDKAELALLGPRDLSRVTWRSRISVCPQDQETSSLPWWFCGNESACQCRRQVFDPWSRRLPHAAEQLSLCVTSADRIF